ncbi:phosphate signaling complex PhoU family protein [Staphylothermus hellenicus]|uniref:Phosphate uptake regulator, PhoU n=1 Tax=Staphylothermus hellenicus (strain DSM 12710 / JCM 10830 / BK20S6-10-b1 / P8) TaxID=591019 RepID=D7DA35_STAHD|nr:phosphate uptake regulator PhoU [Staphylothermus hellenicus]ADI32631.1 phosphate uptake regulator, PhoU [Staphylothermus hellenicus DSM 12710]
MNDMIRRVQITGGSTFIVSLPKEWVKNVGLTPGSEVLIDILPDYSLRIAPLHRRSRRDIRVKEIEVSQDNVDTAIIEILSAYLAGYGIIKIRYKDISYDTLARIIDKVRSKAIGLEILDEKSNELTLYSIVDTSLLTITEALEKMANTTRSMLEDVERILKRYDEKILKSIIERDDVVDKLFLLITRQLNQLLLGELSPSNIGLVALPEALYMIISVKSIERIADHAVQISKNILKNNGRFLLPDQIIELFSKTKDLYIDTIKGLKSLNKKYANKVVTLSKELEKLEEKIRQNLINPLGFPEAYLVLDNIRRIKAYSLDIAESVINIITIREYAHT